MIYRIFLIAITFLFITSADAAKLYDMGDPVGGADPVNDWFHVYDMSVGPTGTSSKININDIFTAYLLGQTITTQYALVVFDGSGAFAETNVLIDASDNVTGAASYATDKVSGVPGRQGVFEGNSTDTFMTGDEGAANRSSDLWVKASDSDPVTGSIKLYGTPVADVSQASWGVFDGVTIEISAGTVQLMDTAVTPGAYINADITINQKGQITLAANGTGGGSIPTEQDGVPLYSDMSTGEWVFNLNAGDDSAYYKSATGMYTLVAVYAVDPVPPTMTSATVATDGNSVSILCSESMTIDGGGGSDTWNLNTPSIALTYASGAPGTTLIYDCASTVASTDNPTITYVQPGNGLENVANVDLVSLTAQAVDNQSLIGATAACSSCGTYNGCTGADLLCWDWDTALSGGTWTTDTDGDAAGIIDIAAAHSGAWACTDKGTQAIDILFDDDTSGDCFTYFDIGASGTEGVDYYAHFSFKFVSDGAMSAFDGFRFFILDSGAGGTEPDFGNINLVIYKNNTDNHELRLNINGSVLAVDNDSNIDEGTLYQIGIRYKFVAGASNDEVELFLDGITQGFKNDTDLSEVPRYVYLGTGSVVSGIYNVNFQVDNLEVDATAMPAVCPE